MIKEIQPKERFEYKSSAKGREQVKVLDVVYTHLSLENEDDLYLTEFGLPFIEHLKPDNFWSDKEWFNKNSVRLLGTSYPYKVTTKKIQGKQKDIVIKWNRMGQDIPVADRDDELMSAEFNSPFEEFSLVMELKNTIIVSSGEIAIQNPLAIYVPSKRLELWQTGRKEYKMKLKIRAHKDIDLDMCRSYAVIYEWIEGIDIVQACRGGILDGEYLELATLSLEEKMQKNDFIVKDRKPHHIIIRPDNNGDLTRDKHGNIFYALVDFELLARTPESEEIVKKSKRADYLKRQKDRFALKDPDKLYPHLKAVNICGVDYIYGHVESTKGRLWIVGKDPDLFDYFLPERWEQTPKTKLSEFSEVYHTVTKDKIHLVWRLSGVGLQPDMDPFKEDENKILTYGYNSPFEEVAIAMELNNKGVATVYPRAIYMVGTKSDISDNLFDNTRYESHKDYIAPDGQPVFKKNHDYITIWGYWNGPDEKLALEDADYYEGIDMLRACREGIITRKTYIDLLQTAKKRLSDVGVEDLNLRGNHLLVSLDSKGALITDKQNKPEIRVCNFEFLKRIE